VQVQYTAADRKRVLWTSEPVQSGPMKLAGDGYVVHYFRFVFGFGQDGGMRWAYSQPRVELVASDHTGSVVVAVSSAGDVVAYRSADRQRARAQEPRHDDAGARRHVRRRWLGARRQDRAGRDGRGADVDRPAIAMRASIVSRSSPSTALAKLPGPDATSQLLAVLADNRQPQRLKDTVAQLLAARRDPGSLPVLVSSSRCTPTSSPAPSPRHSAPWQKRSPVLPGCRSIPSRWRGARRAPESPRCAVDGEPGPRPGDPARWRRSGVAPSGRRSARTCCSTTPTTSSAPTWPGARQSSSRSAQKGGPGERELLRQVGADPRTKPTLATTIRRHSGRSERAKLGEGEPALPNRDLPRSRMWGPPRIGRSPRRVPLRARGQPGARAQRAGVAELLRPLHSGPERAGERDPHQHAPTIGTGFATAPGPRGTTALYNRVDPQESSGSSRSTLSAGSWFASTSSASNTASVLASLPPTPLGSTAKDSEP